LFGSPISKSPSPVLHNTGFEYYNLPYLYRLCETLDINEVVKTIKSENTLGGSVTIPHKQAIIPFLDDLSVAASEIGAVNTVYKIERDGKTKVVGDNTDWIAIHTLAKKRLAQSHPKKEPTQLCGLVIGAGGTAHAACYALSKLGIPFYIWNRTIEKAEELSKKFRGKPCSRLEDLPAKSVDIVIGTVPPTSQFVLPDHLFKDNLVVVELVYFPRETMLIKQAIEKGCLIVEGSEILFEQGLKQFEIFSKKEVPKREMAHALVHKHNGGALAQETPLTFRELLSKL